MTKVAQLLHITDSHLFGEVTTSKNGVNPFESLKQVLQQALREADADAILHTGDLANDPTEETYQLFYDTVREISNAPLICTPGNHDLLEPFSQVCPTDDLALGSWYITTIDSHLDHTLPGRISTAEIDELQANLANRSENCLVATHHPPLPIGVSWLDVHRIDKGQELVDACAQFETVKGLVCGHVHQAHESQYNHLNILTTPSTCWQFAEDQEQFQMSTKPAGWRWLFLHENGNFTTQIGRVTH